MDPPGGRESRAVRRPSHGEVPKGRSEPLPESADETDRLATRRTVEAAWRHAARAEARDSVRDSPEPREADSGGSRRISDARLERAEIRF